MSAILVHSLTTAIQQAARGVLVAEDELRQAQPEFKGDAEAHLASVLSRYEQLVGADPVLLQIAQTEMERVLAQEKPRTFLGPKTTPRADASTTCICIHGFRGPCFGPRCAE